MFGTRGRQLQKCTLHCIQRNRFHLGKYSLKEVIVLFRVLFVQIFLKLSVANFVGSLITPVQRSVLLHCIIGEMYLTVKVIYIEFIRGSANVTLIMPIGFEDTMELTNEQIMANIKFTPTIKKGTINV
jgi:hypothetical protein